MDFLQRSTTDNMEDRLAGGVKNHTTAPLRNSSVSRNFQERSRSEERPLTANRRKSFSRPRTANRPPERHVEREVSTETLQFTTGNTTFNFPTPSPRLPRPPRSATCNGSSSLLPIAGCVNGGSPRIGVAIGSPGQMPPNWGKSFASDYIPPRMPTLPQPSRAPPPVPRQVIDDDKPNSENSHSKKSSWKGWSALFGRKSTKVTSEPPPCDLLASREKQYQNHRTQMETVGFPATTPSPIYSTNHSGRSPSTVQGIGRLENRLEARPDADQASSLPSNRGKLMDSPCLIKRETGVSQSPEIATRSHANKNSVDTIRNDSPLSMTTHRTPHLDLDIPNPQMERYSVMFENLLPERRPSLLERRQSRLLQRSQSLSKPSTLSPIASLASGTTYRPSVGEGALPQRSHTSPNLTQAPRLSIQIDSPNHRPSSSSSRATASATAIHRSRPIPRSKALPYNHHHDSPRNFSTSVPTIIESPLPSSPLPSESSSVPFTPPTASSSSFVVVRNHGSVDPATAVLPEPSWDMVTSQAAEIPPSSPHSARFSRFGAEDAEWQVVQVSVAKQVSVGGDAWKTGGGPAPRGRTAAALGPRSSMVRLPLRPKVVEVSKERKGSVEAA